MNTSSLTIIRGHFTMKSIEMTKILDRIDKPADLKKLTYPELEQLAAEIREELVSVVSANGGHLASNLGVVELTLALHRVFDTPRDKIVWDVGHQAYAHKLVTGGVRNLLLYDSMADYRVLPVVRKVNTILLAPVMPVPRYQPPWGLRLPAILPAKITMLSR